MVFAAMNKTRLDQLDRPWIGLLLLVCAVTTAAVVGIDHYRGSAERARQVQLDLKDVRATAYAADAAEWQARYPGGRWESARRGDEVLFRAYVLPAG